jgi:hypothetical protein
MYYPSSQIKTNLYTNGGEYVIKLNNEDYIGYYYETSNGKKYVGKTPTSKGQIELILPPLVSSEDITYDPQYVRIAGWENDPDPEIDAAVDPLLVNSLSMYNYANLQKSSMDQPRLLPSPYYYIPTEEDEKIGEYQRYFAKKTNEYVYIEISKETYTKFKAKDPTVAWDLYECLEFPWALYSDFDYGEWERIPQKDADITNDNIVALIEKNNKWFGFASYLNTYKI